MPIHPDLDVGAGTSAPPGTRGEDAVPLPYWLALTMSTASAKLPARSTTSTGPKISSV